MTYDMEHEAYDTCDTLDDDEVRARYAASVMCGVIGLGTLIVIVMAGVVLVWAKMIVEQGAVRP